MADQAANAKAIFEQYDEDKSGTLSKEDLVGFFDKLSAARGDLGLSKDNYDAWFSSIDEDGSGTISVEDLEKYLGTINYSA